MRVSSQKGKEIGMVNIVQRDKECWQTGGVVQINKKNKYTHME